MRLSLTSLKNDASLVAYYPFDGNSTDVFAGKNGTDTNVTYVGAQWGQGANMNGDGDIDVATFSNDFFANGGTAVGWLLVDTLVADDIVIQFDDGNTNRIDLVDVSGGNCALQFKQFCAATDGIWRTTNRDISVDTLHHIVVQYDRSGGESANPVIYIDGVSKSITETQTPVAALRTGIDQINFGSDGAGAGFIDGLFDDWAFFTRSLTQGEINELIAAERARNIYSYFM